MSETSVGLTAPGATTWQVLLDVTMGGDTVHPELPDVREDRDYCRHCGPVYYEKHCRSAPPACEYHTVHWVLPRAVVAESDGDETTVVCLDCILELAPQVPARDLAAEAVQAGLKAGAWACHDGSWAYVAAVDAGGYYAMLSLWRGMKTKVVRAGEVEAVSAERPSVLDRLEDR